MTVRVKIGKGEAQTEFLQVHQRLEALGLKVDEFGKIDESSAANIRGGMAAIQALAKDGVIDAGAVAQLRKNTNLLGRITGKDVPISQRDSNAWRSSAMELQGAAKTVRAVTEEIKADGSIDMDKLVRAGDRLGQAITKTNKFLNEKMDINRLAGIDPAAVRALTDAAVEMADAMRVYQIVLSKFRSAALDAVKKANGPEYTVTHHGDQTTVEKRPGFWRRLQTNNLFEALESSINGFKGVQEFADLLSKPMILQSGSYLLAQKAVSGGLSMKSTLEVSLAIDRLADETGLARHTIAEGFGKFIGRNFIAARQDAAYALQLAVYDVLDKMLEKPVSRNTQAPEFASAVIEAVSKAAREHPNDSAGFLKALS